MRAIVTGGLGFIGSYLTELLLDKGHTVLVVDNCSSNVVGPDHFTDRCDVMTTSVGDLYEFLTWRADVVYHLASYVGPVGILKHAGDMAPNIIRETTHLRDICARYSMPLIFVSTSEIYGTGGTMAEDNQKLFENYEVRTEYGASKMLAEILVVNKARVKAGLNYHIVRPFNVVGPGQRHDGGFVLPRFVKAVIDREPMTVYGDGQQRRAFTDVRDVSRAIYDISASESVNEIWNVGNPGNEMTIEQLAYEVLYVGVSLGHEPIEHPIVYVDPKKIHGPLFSEVPDKIPDSTKLFDFGWKPEIPLDKTIEDTFKYMNR